MATINDVCTRALKRSGIVNFNSTPSANQSADALSALNEMLDEWKVSGVDVLKQADYVLSDTFQFFVPPVDLTGDKLLVLAYQGTWDASANSPSLATSTGTEGYVYRVSTAGSTTLDDVTSWAENDYAVFDGTVWLKSRSADQHRNAVTAMLGIKLCSDNGLDPPPPTLAREAEIGWRGILAHFVLPYEVSVDDALLLTSGRRTWR